MRGFVLATVPSYQMGWVHAEICDALDAFVEGVMARRSPRLIICLPPRAGKSQLVSRCLPAYILGRDPEARVIACSYSAALANRFSRDTQRIIDSDAYRAVFPGTRLAGRGGRAEDGRAYTRTSEAFEVVGHGGGYRAAGVGGGITGMGADALIIDDPLKDREEANSATIREGVWDWYASTAYTRLSAGGGVIVMATRWHTDDLIGRLLRLGELGEGDSFTALVYPAIAERDEPHRHAGEALHPERFDEARLAAIRRAIGASEWAALYQQRPVPQGGAILRPSDFRMYQPGDAPQRPDQLITSWDMTFKGTARSDYVVGQVWARKGTSCFLLDQVRGQWDFPRTLEMFAQVAARWPRASRHLIEDKANGTAIISVLRERVHGVTPVTPHEGKQERAQAVAPMAEAGNVLLPAGAPWLPALTDEIAAFPAGAHDDQVDAMTQALNYMREHTGLGISAANIMALRRPRR